MVRPRTFDEQQVLQGAVAIFRERGYAGTRIPDLTDELGICRQSLYATFGDKRGLYLRALEAWGRSDVDAKLALLRAEGSPLENVRTVVRGLAALATACPEHGNLTVAAMVELRRDPDVMAEVERQTGRLEQGFAETLAKAQSRGELAAGLAPEQLAGAFAAASCGIGLLTRLPGSSGRIAAMVSALLRLLAEPDALNHDAGAHPVTPAQRFEPGI
jgi:TetR/AcrR family transcriptional repressor of nem operon